MQQNPRHVGRTASAETTVAAATPDAGPALDLFGISDRPIDGGRTEARIEPGRQPASYDRDVARCYVALLQREARVLQARADSLSSDGEWCTALRHEAWALQVLADAPRDDGELSEAVASNPWIQLAAPRAAALRQVAAAEVERQYERGAARGRDAARIEAERVGAEGVQPPDSETGAAETWETRQLIQLIASRAAARADWRARQSPRHREVGAAWMPTVGDYREAAVAALRAALPRFRRGKAPLDMFLLRVARNATTTKWRQATARPLGLTGLPQRRRWRVQRVALDDLDAEQTESWPDLDDVLDLRRVLERLAPRPRAVLALRLAGFSINEAAARLQIGRRTAQTAARAADAALRRRGVSLPLSRVVVYATGQPQECEAPPVPRAGSAGGGH